MKQIKTCFLTAALTLTAAAFAQALPNSANPYLGSNITRTYTLEDLSTRPGLLQIGKGDMVILDFTSEISAIITPQAAMMDIPEPLGNIAVLTGKVASGSAQLLVQLDNGKYASFAISFIPGGNGMKRIKIEDFPKMDYAQPVVAAPAPSNQNMPSYFAPIPLPASSTFSPAPVVAAAPMPVQPAVAPVMVQAPAPAAPAAPLIIPAPITLNRNNLNVPSATSMNRPQPAWISMNTIMNGQQNVLITVTNRGVRPLTLSSRDLVITMDNRTMASFSDDVIQVAAQAAQTISVPLDAPVVPGTSVRIGWNAFDAGAKTFYALSNGPQ